MWHCCWSGLSISEMADLLGFSCITVFKVYIEWPKKQKLFSEWQISEWKCLWTNCFKLLGILIMTKICRRAWITHDNTPFLNITMSFLYSNGLLGLSTDNYILNINVFKSFFLSRLSRSHVIYLSYRLYRWVCHNWKASLRGWLRASANEPPVFDSQRLSEVELLLKESQGEGSRVQLGFILVKNKADRLPL